MFPNRITKKFENGIVISSEFESGNLQRVEDITSSTYTKEIQEETKEVPVIFNEDLSDNEDATADTMEFENFEWDAMFGKIEDELYCYDIWVSPDGLPYVKGLKTRA